MAELQDISYDGGLEFDKGDFKITESTQQDIEFIMNADAGEFYSSPTLGVGIEKIEKRLSSNIDAVRLKKTIRKNLSADNIRDTLISISQNENDFNINVSGNRLK